MRDKFDFVEEITWNDFGESHYMGPIKGAQPNSQSWVDGYDHTPLLQLNAYYHAAFKTGSYPTITCDKVSRDQSLSVKRHRGLTASTCLVS